MSKKPAYYYLPLIIIMMWVVFGVGVVTLIWVLVTL